MKRRIFSFKDYLSEQEKSTQADKEETGSMLAGMIQRALQDQFDNKDFSEIIETPETKGGLPYSSCGNSGYTFIPVELTNQQVIDKLFKDPGGYFARDIKYVDITKKVSSGSKDLFIVGVREDLEIKKKEGDRFVDKLFIVDPSKPNEKVVSYQITTCPSVSFYSDPSRSANKGGVAIMQPGVYEYKIGIHRADSPNKHEALVQAGEIDIQRFELNTESIETYRPGKPESGDAYGINIHRSSNERGICVGPYSAGCQVFADGSDFDDFMSKIKGAGQSKYLYVLIENDDLPGESSSQPNDEKDKVKEDRSELLAATAEKIRMDLEKSNSDEEGLIDWYNSAVKTKNDAKKISSIYQEEYSVDIYSDLKRALNNSEFARLKVVI